ncbi:MAG TPA: PadR family transcriptional regulator [Acidimicrobiia bacterium]|jgi:PadR family transcriptional regulator PadR
MVTGHRVERSSQLLKGVLDMCLLAVISEQPSYGYEMVRKLSSRGLDLVSDGTIYPVLSRLQRGGLIDSYLEPSTEGPARKYYRITEAGTARLADWTNEWRTMSDGVEAVLEGVTDDGHS